MLPAHKHQLSSAIRCGPCDDAGRLPGGRGRRNGRVPGGPARSAAAGAHRSPVRMPGTIHLPHRGDRRRQPPADHRSAPPSGCRGQAQRCGAATSVAPARSAHNGRSPCKPVPGPPADVRSDLAPDRDPSPDDPGPAPRLRRANENPGSVQPGRPGHHPTAPARTPVRAGRPDSRAGRCGARGIPEGGVARRPRGRSPGAYRRAAPAPWPIRHRTHPRALRRRRRAAGNDAPRPAPGTATWPSNSTSHAGSGSPT